MRCQSTKGPPGGVHFLTRNLSQSCHCNHPVWREKRCGSEHFSSTGPLACRLQLFKAVLNGTDCRMLMLENENGCLSN